MLSHFTPKMLHEVIINGLAHSIRGGIPPTCCPLLPEIIIEKTEEWENCVQVGANSTNTQLGCSLFRKHSQMEMQTIFPIEHEVGMLMLNAYWSGYESIGSPCHHQPLLA